MEGCATSDIAVMFFVDSNGNITTNYVKYISLMCTELQICCTQYTICGKCFMLYISKMWALPKPLLHVLLFTENGGERKIFHEYWREAETSMNIDSHLHIFSQEKIKNYKAGITLIVIH